MSEEDYNHRYETKTARIREPSKLRTVQCADSADNGLSSANTPDETPEPSSASKSDKAAGKAPTFENDNYLEDPFFSQNAHYGGQRSSGYQVYNGHSDKVPFVSQSQTARYPKSFLSTVTAAHESSAIEEDSADTTDESEQRVSGRDTGSNSRLVQAGSLPPRDDLAYGATFD
ncbi:hypothetical protein MMC13_000939 [Lambiella insularis]|nr:hypothetical protein [Lambiella insularis]